MDGSPADRIAIVALGCRVGRADSASVGAALPEPFQRALPGEAAGWVVVAGCAVTGDAAASTRQAIRRMARENPGARIVVAGCHAPGEEGELAALPGVAAVLGARDHAALPDFLSRLRAGEAPAEALAAARAASPAWDAPPDPATGPARPVLKVQDGCDDACAYCAVPLARGASRSLPLAECVARVRALGAVVPEVVLSGVHLGAWGRDLSPRDDLAGLVRALATPRAARRIRLSSVEPAEFPVALLGEESSGILCDHFHFPVQSGSDRVLAAMGRAHRAAEVARAIEAVARARPGAALGADVLTGFPGEGEQEHQATLALLAGLPLAYLHVFPFSPRPGTRAAAMGDRPAPGVVDRRARELRELSTRRWGAFVRGLSGRDVEVVVERVRDGEARGTASEHATVRFPAGSIRRGELVRVRVGDPGVRLDGDVAEGTRQA